MTLHTHLGAQRARSGRTVHAFDTLDGTEQAFRFRQKCARPTSRACSRSSLIVRSSPIWTRGHAQPSQLHRFDKREAGDHLEARNAATPIASWHADESSAAMANALYDECTAVLDDDPPRARPSSLRARRGYRRSTGSKLPARPHSCSREASRLVVPASPSQFGTAATLWPSRRVSSKLRPREEVLDLIAGRSNDERRGPLPPSCRCSRGSVCKVSSFIYSALDRAIK